MIIWKRNKCQPQIRPGEKCSGYDVHPRECDGTKNKYWCDPSKKSCSKRKSNGNPCAYDYSCTSNYCDSKTQKCHKKNSDSTATIEKDMVYIVAGVLLLAAIIICAIAFIAVSRSRAKQRVRSSYNSREERVDVATVEKLPPAYADLPPPYTSSHE